MKKFSETSETRLSEGTTRFIEFYQMSVFVDLWISFGSVQRCTLRTLDPGAKSHYLSQHKRRRRWVSLCNLCFLSFSDAKPRSWYHHHHNRREGCLFPTETHHGLWVSPRVAAIFLLVPWKRIRQLHFLREEVLRRFSWFKICSPGGRWKEA